MLTDDVIIRDSKINGKGVFAARNFKKGEIVLKWDKSHVLLEEEVKKMKNKEKKYICKFNDVYFEVQEPEKFVNHSCDANTTAKDFCDVAIKDIKQGEEITANYIEELPPGTEMKCNCGSKNCKKIIKS